MKNVTEMCPIHDSYGLTDIQNSVLT